MKLTGRRAANFLVTDLMKHHAVHHAPETLASLERSDLVYRALCAILYNFVPQSGHPGGSISSGRIAQALLFQSMDYDFSNPDAQDADILSYAAGHKAMGLYAAWALRNEYVRIARPALLPQERYQLRLEDLLGFRRNPVTSSPLFRKFGAKSLDGHPTPATPFVKLSTGASGVGIATSFGLALAAADVFGIASSPRVHVLEGEGGMTPGRVAEALATAATTRLQNLVLHVDWNQASIDSNQVCREGDKHGDYVQWSPAELLYLNDWNVISVPNGFDFQQILAAQSFALAGKNGQPTAIVYRTVKGWKYGIEGRGSHGAGHTFCSEAFYSALEDFEREFKVTFPRFTGDKTSAVVEQNFFDCLSTIRAALEKDEQIAKVLGGAVAASADRLHAHARRPHEKAPKLDHLYAPTTLTPQTPAELALQPGHSVTLRGVLGDVLNHLNRKSHGALLASSADLAESTSISHLNKGFSQGFYNAVSNAGSRLVPTGGICEDGMGGILAGVSSFGNHIGVGSSYGAFIAALQHVTARLHAIGQQMRKNAFGHEQNPFIIICAHAGPKTGEDGPTHADPQALQLFQENFPRGSMITLTPWCAQEIWPLMAAAFRARPAVIAPFVTRPSEPIVDRTKLNLAPATDAAQGVYALRKADHTRPAGTIVIQGNGVAQAFVTEVLPKLDELKINLNLYYIASAELFDLLPADEQQRIFPDAHRRQAMGITEFTMPLMYRWVTSEEGRRRSLHPFANGHFLGSGQAIKVFKEAGLDGASQLKNVLDYVASLEQ